MMKKLKHKRLVLAGIAAFCCIWHPPNVLAGNGDYDFDLDVDWDDFAYWAGCMTGEGGAPVQPFDACNAFDFDEDRDVDEQDFGAFQAAFQKPPAPGCSILSGSNDQWGASHDVPNDWDEGAMGAMGVRATISPPVHGMKLCGEPSLIKSSSSRAALLVADVPGQSGAQDWFEIGYMRARHQNPGNPEWQPGAIFEGLFAESWIAGRLNIAHSNHWEIPLPLPSPPYAPVLVLPNGGHPEAVGLPSEEKVYWSSRGLGGKQHTWYFKVGSIGQEMHDAPLFHSYRPPPPKENVIILFNGDKVQVFGELKHAEDNIPGTESDPCKFTDIKYRDAVVPGTWWPVYFTVADVEPQAPPDSDGRLSEPIPGTNPIRYKTVEMWDKNPQ